MSNLKVTPGNWHYVSGGVWSTPLGPDDGGQCIATRSSNARIAPTERDANLRLCASAKAMFEALEAISSFWEGYPSGTVEPLSPFALITESDEPICAVIQKILAQAKGEL